MVSREVVDRLEAYLMKMHAHQVAKATKIAHELNKHLTDEDLLNPDNFPYVVNDPRYTYEDGMAAGIMSAKIAIRSFLLSEEESEEKDNS